LFVLNANYNDILYIIICARAIYYCTESITSPRASYPTIGIRIPTSRSAPRYIVIIITILLLLLFSYRIKYTWRVPPTAEKKQTPGDPQGGGGGGLQQPPVPQTSFDKKFLLGIYIPMSYIIVYIRSTLELMWFVQILQRWRRRWLNTAGKYNKTL